MAHSRLLIRSLVLLALTGVCATAQIAGPGGPGGAVGPLTCAANVFNPSQVRVEGFSELVGDIVLTCTGGASLPRGSAVPTVKITVYFNAEVTSKTFGNGLSETLLLIDEPSLALSGSLPQTVCSGGLLGAGGGGCQTYANTGAMTSIASTCTAFTNGLCTAFGSTPNVFQGAVTQNQVTFNGVPILAPVTAGLARVFRITNVRVNAHAMSAAPGSIVQALVSAAGGVSLPISNPTQVAAYPFNGLRATSVRSADNTAPGTGINVPQCSAVPLTPGAVLRFTEHFANAFRTRIAPTLAFGGGVVSGLSGSGAPVGSNVVSTTFAQNMPGTIYQGSESGLIMPVSGGQAGLADFGSRLKATFSNIPAGVSIYVSTANIDPQGAVSNAAALISNGFAIAAPGDSLPLLAGTVTSGGVNLYGPLPVDSNGTANAVWEVLATNPNALEDLDFAVFYSATGNPPASPTATVTLSWGSGVGIPRFDAATASIPIVNVVPCASAAGLTSSANPSVFGRPVTLTATVTSALATPTGSVTFKDGSTTLGTAALVNGSASLTLSTLVAGSHTLTAVYSGGGFSSAVSGPVSQVVSQAPTTTTLNLGAADTSPYTATVTSSAGTPTGTVTFRDFSLVMGTVAVVNGTASLPRPVLPVGNHSISASYNGDSNFLASVSSTQTVTISRPDTSVSTPELRSGNPIVGQTLTFAASVNAGDRRVTGMLAFLDGGNAIGTADLDASGGGSISTSRLSAGIHVITASYSGDPGNAPSTSGPLFLRIRAASTVALISSANPSTAGAPITFTATVAGSGPSGAPSGTVNFSDGATLLKSVALDASGQAALTLPSGLAAGDHSIVAAYGGDADYTAASSIALVQRVNKTPTQTALSETVEAGLFYLTASVTAGSGAPSGPVQFMDVTTGVSLGAAALAGNTASLRLNLPLPVGHSIQAVFAGDEVYAASSSASLPFIAAANAFSFGFSYVPDGVSSIFGAGLAASTESAAGLPLPTTLAGVAVRITDRAGKSYPALLYYASPGQINFVIPGDVPAGPATLTVISSSGPLTVAITITRVAPALTSADGSGSGTAAAQVVRLHLDGTQDPPVAASPSPIPVGDGDRLFLILYGSGLRNATGPVSCSLNGRSVAALYSGAHALYPGLDQINLEVPGGLRGVIAVSCTADGQVSNVVTLNVQ